MRSTAARTAVALHAAAVTGACIPYAVGTTAQTVPPGQHLSTMSVYPLPAIELDTSRAGGRALTADAEFRFGIAPRADVGLRAVGGFSGVVVNTKRMLTDTSGVRVAVMPGIGLVNLGNHVYAEFTTIVSGPERMSVDERGRQAPGFVPYGGLRAMHVWPLAHGGVNDRPTYGGFVGARIGSRDLGVSVEVGVFHDHSALGVRADDIVVVPSIHLHGEELIRILGDAMRLVGATRGRR